MHSETREGDDAVPAFRQVGLEGERGRLRHVGHGGWTGSNDEESMRSLQRAVDLGCNFFDTARAYGDGRSEALLGRLVRANPGVKLYTATKIPPKNLKWPSRREFSLDEVFPPGHIEEYVERSLAGAGLDHFDLVQFHVWEDAWAEDGRLDRNHGVAARARAAVGRRHQHQPLGAVERAQHGGKRPRRCGAGDLQHLRSEPRRRAPAHVLGHGRGGDRPRTLRRGAR